MKKHIFSFFLISISVAGFLTVNHLFSDWSKSLTNRETPLNLALTISNLIPDEPVAASEENLSTAILIASSDGQIIDCANKPLRGLNNRGIGILVKNFKDVTIKNCSVSGFYFGLLADNADGLKIINSQFNNNNEPAITDIYVNKLIYPYALGEYYAAWPASGNQIALKSGLTDNYNIVVPVTLADLSNSALTDDTVYGFNDYFNFIDHRAYSDFPSLSDSARRLSHGGGVVIQNSTSILIQNISAKNNSIGLNLLNVDNSAIIENNLSHNYGFGLFLHNASGNEIKNNNISFSGYPNEWLVPDDIDNAALIITNGSGYNHISDNNFDNSHNGLVLSGAPSPPYPTSDYNSIINNTARHISQNAFTVSHSFGNRLQGNNLENSRAGLLLVYGNGHLIDNNTIKNNSAVGLTIINGLNYTIKNNHISAVAGSGLTIASPSSDNGWETLFPKNSNLKIFNNNFSDNQTAFLSASPFYESSIYANNLSGNQTDWSETGSGSKAIDLSLSYNNHINLLDDTAPPACETLVSGLVTNPYQITFTGLGFSEDEIAYVRDNFIPACTNVNGPLNPYFSFPDVSINPNIPNLGLFAHTPLKEARSHFTINYAGVTANTFGCDKSGHNCDYESMKQGVKSICPNTNLIIALSKDGNFHTVYGGEPNPFVRGVTPIVHLGVSSDPARLVNEHWGACTEEFAEAFAFLAEERIDNPDNPLPLADTGYMDNKEAIANCSLQNECQVKFGDSACVPGCAGSKELYRPSSRSLMSYIDLNLPSSLTFNEPSVKRLRDLLLNSFFSSGFSAGTTHKLTATFELKNSDSDDAVSVSSLRVNINDFNSLIHIFRSARLTVTSKSNNTSSSSGSVSEDAGDSDGAADLISSDIALTLTPAIDKNDDIILHLVPRSDLLLSPGESKTISLEIDVELMNQPWPGDKSLNISNIIYNVPSGSFSSLPRTGTNTVNIPLSVTSL